MTDDPTPVAPSAGGAEVKVVTSAFRNILAHANTLLGAVGIFLVAGFALSLIGTLGFAELAEHVSAGATQAFDEKVLVWLSSHRNPLTDTGMLELTALGTGTVVLMISGIASMFLALTKHKYSALLLGVATAGGLALNMVLKIGFHRPRPDVVVWGTEAFSSSFPSGHAMSAAIVYSTVAYLAARLQKRLWSKILTMFAAVMLIILICLSRLYLGVHYPSDVAAGVTIGLAWAGFCMATLEGIQRFARRGDKGVERTPTQVDKKV
jgi:undecaprenyl-diphosphatase